MIWVKPFTSLVFSVIILYCFSPRFCTAQGNNATRNACETYAICGAFGSCNSQKSPICACLRGFVPANSAEWNSGNWTNGCVRRTPLLCQRNGTLTPAENKTDGFLTVKMVKVPGYASREFRPKSECPGICLGNCSCIAYAHDNDLGCMFWNGTLFDIQKFPSGLGSDLYFRVANSELVSTKNNTKLIVALVIVGPAVASIFLFFGWKWMRKRRGRKRRALLEEESSAGLDSVDASLQEVLSKFKVEELPLFKFEVIEKATDNFSSANRLGKGGFGPVYKGELVNGKLIAVKRLSKGSVQGMQEFMNEVVLISKLQHRNLVRLLGCCVENKEKMLVYEYMPNKSLDFYLFDQSQEVLDWNKRFSIIEGICRGLLYLHRDSRLKIVHRDLKPSNILLDDDWNPKISDFGMARIFGSNQDHVSTIRVVGTYGYMSPEYAIEGRFSEKSDVFSFGVLMLEIISGRRNTSYYDNESSVSLLGHVWKLWLENNITASIDERIASPRNLPEVMRCIHIGLLCVQELPRDRPSVSAVLSMLSSEIVELPEPKQVAFAIKSRRGGDAGTSSSQQSQKTGSSINSMSLTMVDGR